MGFFDTIKKSTVKGLQTVGGATKDLYEKGKDKLSKKDTKTNEPAGNTDYPAEEQPKVGAQPIPTEATYTNPHSYGQVGLPQQQPNPGYNQQGFGSQPIQH